MDDEYYQKWIYPIMYNYLSDKKYFQRNAAIAIGNTGDHKYIPALEKAMQLPDELIRIHAAWALGRMNCEEADRILRKSLEIEKTEEVREEIIADLREKC